ncbi:MAG: hypothetical protein Q4D94_00585 [Bacillota bacterium]|nr:hypothetical protein [Bacillota bacterium]
MGTNIGRGDNVMREMARETNLLEHDRKTEAGKDITPESRKRGIIAFGCTLAVVAVIVFLFIVL